MTGPPATEVAAGTGSQAATAPSSDEAALLREVDLLQKLLLTVPETAFLCRVGARTVWRMLSDPNSGFPTPRRLGGRTLLARDDVLAFLKGDSAR